MNLSVEDIITYFPTKAPYKFIDEIISVDTSQITGAYRFKKEEFFYSGHFPGFALTPGAILMEAAAQVGLLAFGMYLLGNSLVELSDIPLNFLPKDLTQLPNLSGMLDSIDKELPSGIPREALDHLFFLSSSEMTYKKIVHPGERVIITAEKIFFRLNKLKCNVLVCNEEDEVLCRGIISGFIVKNKSWKSE